MLVQAVYPDLSTHNDWPVEKGLCFVCRDRQKGNSNHTSGNSLSPLGVQNKDLCAALQTVLIRVKLSSARRLRFYGFRTLDSLQFSSTQKYRLFYSPYLPHGETWEIQRRRRVLKAIIEYTEG